MLKESRASSTRTIGSWMRLLILLSFLSLAVIRTPPDFFGMITSGFEYREVECRITPTTRYLFGLASTSVAKIGLIWWGREVTGALPSGTEPSKGIREKEQKSVLDLEKTPTKSQRSSPSCSVARGARAVKIKWNCAQK